MHRVVDKQREIFLFENVRIHLDRVEGLGEFLELEAVYSGEEAQEEEQHRKIEFLLDTLQVCRSDLIAVSYEDLLGGPDGQGSGCSAGDGARS